MQDAITFLNDNAGAIQAFFAIVVGIATVVTVWLSGGMLRQMRYTNQRLEQPNVQVVLQPGRISAALFDLVIRNQGGVPVYDVRVDVTPKDLPGLTHDILANAELFKKPMPVLVEGQEVRTLFLNYIEIANMETGLPIVTFTVSYRTAHGKGNTQAFSYDMGVYHGLMEAEEKTLKHVADQLKEMTKEIKKVARSGEELSTYLYWASALMARQLPPDASLGDACEAFTRAWSDFTATETPYVAIFATLKIRGLSSEVYDKLESVNQTSTAHQELRMKLLEMSAHPRQLSQSFYDKFLKLGNEAVALMQQLHVQRDGNEQRRARK